MPPVTRRAVLLALAPAVFAPAFIARVTPYAAAAKPARSLVPAMTGAYALPDRQAKVAATLTATPTIASQPGTQILDIAMTRLGTGQPVTRFETELSKQLHLIAVSGDLRTFAWSTATSRTQTGASGYRTAFPHAGLWHVYGVAPAPPARQRAGAGRDDLSRRRGPRRVHLGH